MSTVQSIPEEPEVEFWFDPICPWCWMTSRWASEVAAVRGFEITWHPLSLAILNEDNEPNEHSVHMLGGHRLGRVVEAARVAHGQEVVGKLYTAFGTRIHPGQRSDFDGILAEALAELGLPAELAAAADDEALDAPLRANTNHAMEIAGPDVGVPIISVNGVAFFGPVVTPAPTGETALRLWDGIVAAASVPGFYELKRGRTAGPQF
ncbi:DSBA-like thioredoxin domain-containing protein [Leucobacter luti]|uniref:DSBA-like thioredoxin domain-containing protein n=1 Tax=Leucobacter luti TaxID=340320 RepID=A0A4R6RTX9_9MICO|nr:DsbA family protein [Leucobacter luti]TDP90340.1 DSBA-like thioredoxin domain-containing protein [Leucobacter luti]